MKARRSLVWRRRGEICTANMSIRVALVPIVMMLWLMLMALVPAQATTPLNVVTDGPYDFEIVAQTGKSDLAKTTGTVFLEFVHRDTLRRYTAAFPGGFSEGEEKSLRLKFGDGARLENIKWFRVYNKSTDEWGVEQIRIYRPGGHLYYELNPANDAWHDKEWIDAAANWREPYYSNEMIQFLPTPPIGDQATRMRVKLVTKKPVGDMGDITVRLFHRNRTAAEAFTFASSQSADLSFDIKLSSRLGEYRRIEIESASADLTTLRNVHVFARNTKGEPYRYFARDMDDDGHDWSAKLGGGASNVVGLNLVGASVKHKWTHDAGTTNVVLENYFQGYEIWANGDGIGYANAAFLETLRSARPGRADLKNPIAISLYKARETHHGQASLYKHISAAGALPYTDVKFMLQKYEDLNDPNVRFYKTDAGVMTERKKSMMHNKFVLVGDTPDGPTVTTSTANWSTNAQGRWQSSLRVSGMRELWLGYQRYFDNLFKYHPETNVADIGHAFAPSKNWRGGTPNRGGEFSESVPCPTACEDKGVHEYAAKYDTPEIINGALRARGFFYPRPSATESSPVLDEFLALETWLSSDLSRRAELFIMHLSQRDDHIYNVVHRLHANPQVDVKVLVSVKGNHNHMNGIAKYQGKAHPNVTGLDAKFSHAGYEVHTKNIVIRKWHLDGENTVVDSIVLITGSYNMIVSTLTDRDENLMRIEWTDGKDRSFEQQAYRPHLDQFMRAWNSYKMTKTVGNPYRSKSIRSGSAESNTKAGQ